MVGKRLGATHEATIWVVSAVGGWETARVKAPAPLRPGSVIGITSPSSGVADELRPRLDVALDVLRARGYEVVVGECIGQPGVTSAPAPERAAELMAMLCDPVIEAVVPPWGGELAVEILPLLDFDALADAAPTWVVGYSDISTLLLPLTCRLGWVTLHGQNLMDTPYRVPAPLASWLDVVSADQPATFVQGPSEHHRAGGHDDWAADPGHDEFTLDSVGSWRPLDPSAPSIHATGTLIGGCVETTSMLAGTPFGDVAAFAAGHAPDGLIVYVEAAEEHALGIARSLWRMRLAGWFDRANAVLVGRTRAPDDPGFTQVDAVRSALAGLDVPVLLDVDCGHVPPHLVLANGARTVVEWTAESASIGQTFGA